MGMDVYGVNPKQNQIDDSKFKVYLKYNTMDFDDKWEELKENDKLRKQFYQEMEDFESINPGRYFRNNVWWWRPLWSYVSQVCDDILSEEDMAGCHDNSGYHITEDKAVKIGVKLTTLVLNGETQQWKDDYDKELTELPKEPCYRCNGNNHGHDKKKDCESCDKTGERENFHANYPFNVENVEHFANFCIESGGFTVC